VRIEVVVGGLRIGCFGDVELQHVCVHACRAQLCDGLLTLRQIARADDDLNAGIL
jgi:hypothetical protein